jgi:capsular exopolysaccharide synthesis family protein
MSDFLNQIKKLTPSQSGDPLSLSAGTSQRQVEEALQLKHIPTEEVHVPPNSRIVLHTDPSSPGADRFRYLRMCLRELWSAGKLRSLLITSALPNDGKSTMSLNLATALAEGGKRSVLLLEGDLHNPSLSNQLGLENRSGLSDCLEAGLNPFSAIRRLEPLNWYFLPAGNAVGHPTELLQTEALALLMQKLSSLFDWVIVDSPPVIPVTDALSLARQTSATILVAREGCTPREAVEKAVALIGKQRLLGVILNGVEGLDRLYSGYYGYYGNSHRTKSGSIATPPERPAAGANRTLPLKYSIIAPQDH